MHCIRVMNIADNVQRTVIIRAENVPGASAAALNLGSKKRARRHSGRFISLQRLLKAPMQWLMKSASHVDCIRCCI